MSRVLMVIVIAVTILLLAIGTVSANKISADISTPEGTINSLFGAVQARDWKSAYELVSNKNTVDLASFTRDLNGNNGDLRTFSTLSRVTPKVLRESDSQ